ncbi:hypothetical protein Ocin01_13499 [Orchesella cincta]|uniref:Uncharacterized protein n=1 Tax=Orchesella cincta TaxID=48709 RepID=A0A1D2MJN4_ORCCI|nr:hypothetical protein Ocin01_13499 [Orchesella cincta]
MEPFFYLFWNTGVTGVRINSLTVPQIIRNGTEDSVILDCDYSVDEAEKKGLVVKWFHERKQSPVYQWIPHKKPIDLGILKGKLNLDFRADSDEFKLHRALQIIRPTTELSGKKLLGLYLQNQMLLSKPRSFN